MTDMERLTERDEFGNADIIGVDSADLQLNLEYNEFNLVTSALNRLAAYEDTGLEPEEINKSIQWLKYYRAICSGIPPERVSKLLKAEHEGRLVVLPCKVGDTVWVFGTVEGSDPTPWNVRCVGVTAENPGFGIELSFKSFGKTWFLTREAAEAALAERERGSGHA